MRIHVSHFHNLIVVTFYVKITIHIPNDMALVCVLFCINMSIQVFKCQWQREQLCMKKISNLPPQCITIPFDSIFVSRQNMCTASVAIAVDSL